MNNLTRVAPTPGAKDRAIDRVAARLNPRSGAKPTNQRQPLTRGWAQVTAIHPASGTVDVTMDSGPIPGVAVLASYTTPVIGDSILVDFLGANPVAIGPAAVELVGLYRAHVIQRTAQSIAANTYTPFAWDTVTDDPTGMFLPGSYAFQVPIAGWWRIDVMPAISNLAVGSLAFYNIEAQNPIGTTVERPGALADVARAYSEGATDFWAFPASTRIQLQAQDCVHIPVYMSTACTTYNNTPGGYSANSFGIKYDGPL